MKNKENIHIYTLENNTHKVNVSNFGGALLNYIIKDVEHHDIDVVLGHKNLEDYETNNGTLGVIVGRHANRIEDAYVVINNIKYDLDVNHFHNNLHTGVKGLQFKTFDAAQDGNTLTLTTTVKHLEDGFPGNLDVKITYELVEDTLSVHYDASADMDTVVNLTNHSYFNLNGQDGSNIYNHNLYVNSDFFMPNNNFSLVTGEIIESKQTPFDFKNKKNIKAALLSDDDQVKPFNGIDHNFLLNTHLDTHVVSLDNGILSLNIVTDLSAMHIYTGNHFPDDTITSKNDVIYQKHGGIAFETQYSPNSMQMPWLKSPLLKKGDHFISTTSFQLKKVD